MYHRQLQAWNNRSTWDEHDPYVFVPHKAASLFPEFHPESSGKNDILFPKKREDKTSSRIVNVSHFECGRRNALFNVSHLGTGGETPSHEPIQAHPYYMPFSIKNIPKDTLVPIATPLTHPKNCAKIIKHMPLWWNGRHRGLKIRWGRLRTGSSPVSGTRQRLEAIRYERYRKSDIIAR